ncbi:hypothetical protein HELRODRAFT_173374 [Helobdella robusta]|uniref:Uncharacterized protein n=1 Tax=Helobdella robusta TaxID=6412 RepID=T1F6Q8_HELRO|nr:hypothetical protein HELRODRAFT_173374 [Helobdella robusta]ESO03676.1 hypothetical protein HELRODRAFT_173374 [Helobdella robusta]
MARLLSSPCTSLLLLIIASVSVIDVAGGCESGKLPSVGQFCKFFIDKSLEILSLNGYPGCGGKRFLHKTAQAPTVIFEEAEDDSKYILVMVDPDAPDPSNPVYQYWLHWIRKNIMGHDLKKGVTSDNNDLVEFNPPTPPSGLHRYQFLLFKEPSNFTPNFNDRRERWSVSDFVKINSLCENLVSGYEFVTGYEASDDPLPKPKPKTEAVTQKQDAFTQKSDAAVKKQTKKLNGPTQRPDGPTQRPAVPTQRPAVPTQKPNGPTTRSIVPPVLTEFDPQPTLPNVDPNGSATCSASLLIIFSSAFNVLMIFKIY